jgi:hypothetical protein
MPQGAMVKAAKTWVLIAHRARARIAVDVGPGKGLKPAFDHDFAASHAATSDLVSDRPGRLRMVLKPRIRNMVTAEVGKDLTHLDLREVPKHLADRIAL